MKIIQICVALDAEGNESLYGLSTDGDLYVHCTAFEPRKSLTYFKDREGHELSTDRLPVLDPPLNIGAKLMNVLTQTWRYSPGSTGGWKLVTERQTPLAHPTYHPEDPEH